MTSPLEYKARLCRNDISESKWLMLGSGGLLFAIIEAKSRLLEAYFPEDPDARFDIVYFLFNYSVSIPYAIGFISTFMVIIIRYKQERVILKSLASTIESSARERADNLSELIVSALFLAGLLGHGGSLILLIIVV